MAMHTSRKGIKLNDSRYFQHYSPHTRKKMAVMRVFPKILVSKLSNKVDSSSVSGSRPKNSEKVVIGQRSEEIASFMYTEEKNSDDSVNSDKVKTQDQEIQTDIEPHTTKISQPGSSKRSPPLIRRHGVSSILESSHTRENSSELKAYSKLKPGLPVVIKETRDSNNYIEDDHSETNSWWRNTLFKHFIVDFFLQLLGRNASRKKSRENVSEKDYSVATSTKDKAQKSGRSERHDGRKCSSKKYAISYEATQHKRRVRRRKGDEVIFDLIRLTEDENLRATILEQALRTRILEEENARFRKKLAEKLKTRQRSSPLY